MFRPYIWIRMVRSDLVLSFIVIAILMLSSISCIEKKHLSRNSKYRLADYYVEPIQYYQGMISRNHYERTEYDVLKVDQIKSLIFPEVKYLYFHELLHSQSLFFDLTEKNIKNNRYKYFSNPRFTHTILRSTPKSRGLPDWYYVQRPLEPEKVIQEPIPLFYNRPAFPHECFIKIDSYSFSVIDTMDFIYLASLTIEAKKPLQVYCGSDTSIAMKIQQGTPNPHQWNRELKILVAPYLKGNNIYKYKTDDGKSYPISPLYYTPEKSNTQIPALTLLHLSPELWHFYQDIPIFFRVIKPLLTIDNPTLWEEYLEVVLSPYIQSIDSVSFNE